MYSNEILYKYRTIDNLEFFLDTLLNNRLYAASFKDMNDPMEGVYVYRNGGSIDERIRNIICRFDNVHMTENPHTFKIIENHKDYFVVQTEYIKGAGLNNIKIYKLPYTINNPESGNPTIEN